MKVLIFGSSSSVGKYIRKNSNEIDIEPTFITSTCTNTQLDGSHIIKDYSVKSIENLFSKIGIDYDGIIISNGKGSTEPRREWIEEWEDIFEVNLYTPVKIIESYLKRYVAQDCKHNHSIVAISSVASIIEAGAPNAYNSAKAALNRYIQGKAAEVGGLKIRINGLLPSHMESPTWNKIGAKHPGKIEDYLRRNKIGRLVEPKDLVDIALYLISKRGEYINGQLITIDSGCSQRVSI